MHDFASNDREGARRSAQLPLPAARAIARVAMRPLLNPRFRVETVRGGLDLLTRFPRLPEGVEIETVTLGGRATDRISTADSRDDRAVLYFHGGGYCFGSRRTHRALTAHLAAHVGATVFVPDYRLAPEDPYPAALDDALATYQDLLDRGFDPAQVAVAGDSAGGGLSLALALRIRKAELAQPAVVGLISPLVDARLEGLNDKVRDPLLTRAFLEWCIDNYGGQSSNRALRTTHELSPLLADLSGFPPLVVHHGSEEILRDDILRFVTVARTAGVTVTHRELKRHWHVTHLLAGTVREATAAVELLGSSIRSAFGDPRQESSVGSRHGE